MVKFINNGGVTSAKGFVANGLHCGIRKNKTKKDLALIFSETLCNAAAVYTKNLVKGAPLIVNKENLKNGKAQAIICNSGIANTCASDGVEKAQMMCKIAAKALSIDPTDVMVGSTGVIGESLKIEPIVEHIDSLVSGLCVDGGALAAEAIMTTDTIKKEFAVTFDIGGKTCVLGAIAKGSGMINPNMATMLSYITTDCAISVEALSAALAEVVEDSYNMISVDGDTSTNDNVIILANGLALNEIIEKGTDGYAIFVNALKIITVTIAKKLAKDGEGATKLIECNVLNAKRKKDAATIAKSIISSSLVKAAFFGEDANCGRILCAAGYSGVEFDPYICDVSLKSNGGEILVYKSGAFLIFDEALALKILKESEVAIYFNMNVGNENATAWGCDLTYDYVKINGDYRT